MTADRRDSRRTAERMRLELWLRAPKLRADIDAPTPEPDYECMRCQDTGILSYHDLPGPYGVEPCPDCRP